MPDPPRRGVFETFTAQDDALLAFGQKAYTGSIDLFRENAKAMVTLVASLFAVYFAVLSFLGYKYLPAGTPWPFAVIALVPPGLLIGALLLYTWVTHPVFARIELQDLTHLRAVRDARVYQMARRTKGAQVLFVLGLIAAVAVAVIFLVWAPTQGPP